MSTDTSITTLDPQQLSLVLRPSENSRVTEEDRTLVLYESSIAGMQAQIRELADKNRTLYAVLVTKEGQHREIEVLHTAEITALQEKVKTSEDAAEAMRKEMQDTMQKAHKMVQVSLAREEAAVRVATELADARVVAAKQEIETQMKGQRRELLQQIRKKIQDVSNSLTAQANDCNVRRHGQGDNYFWMVSGEGQQADRIKRGEVDPLLAWLGGLQ